MNIYLRRETLPYIFALNPAMLFVDTTVMQVVLVVATSFVGMFGVAAAFNGYLFKPMNPLVRIILAAGGLLMMYPGTASDLIGLVLLAGGFAWQYFAGKGKAGATPA